MKRQVQQFSKSYENQRENRLPPRRSLWLVTIFPVNTQTELTAQCPGEERRPIGGFSKHTEASLEGAGCNVELKSCLVL